MKELRFRLILIIGAIALSLYLLYPTYVNYHTTKRIDEVLTTKSAVLKAADPKISNDVLDDKLKSIEDSIKASDPSIAKEKSKSLKLGLDLQGGMRVVLEVNTSTLLEKLAKSPDDEFKAALAQSEKEAAISNTSLVDLVADKLKTRGIRLSRYYGNIRDDDSKIISDLKKSAEDAVARAMEIIRNRVDQYGVSEPSIQREGSRRIIVELPGVAREEEAKQLLQGTALLEFKLVKEAEFTLSVMQKIDNTLAGNVSLDSTGTDTTNSSTTASTDTTKNKKNLSAEEMLKKHPFFSVAILNPKGQTADAYVRAEDRDKLKLWLARPDVQKVIPE